MPRPIYAEWLSEHMPVDVDWEGWAGAPVRSRGMDDGPRDDERLTPRLVAVAGLGFLLFVPPLLSLFDSRSLVLGVPVLWAYLFVAWAVLIGLVAVVVRRSG